MSPPPTHSENSAQNPQASQQAKTSSATPSLSSSNSLLDLLAGAPARVTSPTSTSTATSSAQPSTPSKQVPLLSSPTPSSSSVNTITAASNTSPSTSIDAAASTIMSSNPQQKYSQDVSHLMQQFMAPTSPLVILSPNSKLAHKNDPMPDTSNKQSNKPSQPVITNKALQLPPSPPSSVSSASGSRARNVSSGVDSPVTRTPPSHDSELGLSTDSSAAPSSSAAAESSPAVKTPFDFVSPFDMLSNRDQESTPQPTSAQAQPQTTSSRLPEESNGRVAGYEAADAGIASLMQKLSPSAAANKPQQKSSLPPKPTESTSAADAGPSTASKAEEAESHIQRPRAETSSSSSSKSAASASSPKRPIFRRLPTQPAVLDAPDKQFHTSRHVALLKQDDAFDEPKSSGLSILSPSRSSSAPSIATLDLAAQQPGGLSSLRNTKVETSGVALIGSPFHFPCNVSAAGLLPASRIANLGHDVACYAMSKGKFRLIHIGTGARLLVQTPSKAGVRSIAAFQSSEDDGMYLLAALTERSKEAQDEGVVFWRIPASFVQQGTEDESPALLGRITADPHKSPFMYRFTAIAFHQTEPRIAISTSDSNVMVVDIAQQLLYHTEPSSPSKKVRSLSESEVDPENKDVAHNEPLCGFAFSPDGSMLATISAPLEGDVSWILGFKQLDGSSHSAESDSTYMIKSPLQQPMIISHLSFIYGPSSNGKGHSDGDDAHAIRGVIVGFRCNTIIGLYDMASRTWKHVWQFDGPAQAHPGVEEHFNLIQLDTASSSLLVCNSFRSSIFAIPLELQPLQPRGQDGLLPWSIQLSYPIKEFALQDPCTSISLSAARDDEEEPSRLFVAFPEGVSVVRLLTPEPPAEEKKDDEKQVEEQAAEAKIVDPAPEPTPAPEPVAEAPAVEAQPTPSKSAKKKNKKKKAAAAAAAAQEHVEEPEVATERSEPAPRAPEPQQDEPIKSEAPEKSQPDLSSLLPKIPVLGPTPAPAPAPAPEAAPVTVKEIVIEKPVTLSASADDVNAALSDTIVAAVHKAVSSNIESSFQHSIETAIPKEVERLITSTELKAELTRNIAQTILPSVQRTAMEVVSRVLAPHFEEVMMQVSDRVERAIVSEITNVRKTLVEEQSESLKGTEQTVQAIQKQVNEVLGKLKDLNAEQADNKITEVRDDDAEVASSKAVVKAQLGSADELSEIEAAPAVAKAKGDLFSSNKDAAALVRKQTAPITKAVAPAQISTKCQLPERVAIIGAGPVGCLAALAFAQRGCKVDIFESRPDPRTHEAIARSSQRSINLALSTRGITGLRSVSLVGLGSTGKDLADLVLEDSVPMRARMIHVVTKRATMDHKAEVKEQSQLYSNKGEYINSVDRGRLNNILLDHALMHPNVEVHFEHKLQSVDFDHDSRSKRAAQPTPNGINKKAIKGPGTGGESSADEGGRRGGKKGKRNAAAAAQQQQLVNASSPTIPAGAVDRVKLEFDIHSNNQTNPKSPTTHHASLVVGCDGAHSSVRSAMGSLIRMHYTHNYIDTGYVELSIPPRTSLSSGSRTRGSGGTDGKPHGHDAFHLDPNHLHIWPRHSFMLIALPNLDGSFTCTLFAPFKMFASELSTREGILAFFEEHFPDALPLIGEDKLVECLTTRRASALGSVQCDPYHYKDRAILIGDAAHAMLPFYGQGLNCGFEDVRVLFDIIDSNDHLEQALESYTKQRHPDLVSILQLAEQNYREMAHSVVSWPYLLRKKLDGLLMALLPSSMWSSLYAMTTFSNLPYSQVIKTEKRQQRVIANGLLTMVVGIMTGAGVDLYVCGFLLYF
ncbi:hypothetical protein NDA16_004011 [Ustilago loliicola]|nr:hypothetical protein NDA16_004011 [Ustilago loliicola]